MKRFLEILRVLRSVFGFVVLLVLAGFAFLAWRGPTIESGSILIMDLQGSYLEAPEPGLASRVLELSKPGPVTMLSLVSTLEKAGRDERLAGVVLRIRDLEIGWGKAQEIRGALERMRARGRHTIAFLETEGFASNLEYYVASAADEVHAPAGVEAPVGLAAEYFFLGGVWDKLDIDLQVERTGPYKSFADFISAEEMSEAHREMADSLLDSIEERYVSGVEARRKLGSAGVKGMIAHPIGSARELVERGIFDGMSSLPVLLEQAFGAASEAPRVDGSTYVRVDMADVGFDPVARVAIVYGAGPVVVGAANISPMANPVLASETVSNALQQASEDEGIAAIVLRIDSPGGSALASEIVWHAVRRAAARRPVIVSFSDVAASGGYYVASGADAIVSQPSTLTGSIGVVSVRPALGGMLERVGIGFDSSTRGEHADLLLSTRLPSPESRAIVQESIDKTYHRFIERVATGRGLATRQVEAVAEGRVWTGAQAAERGLVDELGGFDTAIRLAKRAAEVDEEADVTLVVYPRMPSVWQQVREGLGLWVRREATSSLPGLSSPAIRTSPAIRAATEGGLVALALRPDRPALIAPITVVVR